MARLLALLLVWLALAPPAAAQTAPSAVASRLAPTGVLRVALLVTNPNIASKDPATGAVRGVAVDLGRALAERIGVPFVPVEYQAPPRMLAGATAGEWDVVFVGVDPARAEVVDFAAPYVDIDQTYLVPAGSPIGSAAEADRAGGRIAVNTGNIPDLVLTRELRRSELVRVGPGDGEALDLLRAGKADAFASDRGGLLSAAQRLPGSRVLSDRFFVNQHAIGLPKGRAAALDDVRAFVAEAKASGLVKQAIDRAGLQGVQVSSTPAQLPRTGTPSAALLVVLGAGALLLGHVLTTRCG